MGQLRKLAKRLGFTDAVVDTFHPISTLKLRGLAYRFRLQYCGWATVIHPFVVIQGGKYVWIGEYSALNSFVHIWGHKGVWIGDRVMIASHVSIVSVSHDHSADSMRFAKPIGGPVVIEDDAWIGAQAVIMPGITIGKGAVVGAGAVVRENVPPYAIVAGVPARLIRYRNVKQTARAANLQSR